MQMPGNGPVIFGQLAKLICATRSSEYNSALASKKLGELSRERNAGSPLHLVNYQRVSKRSIRPVLNDFWDPGKNHFSGFVKLCPSEVVGTARMNFGRPANIIRASVRYAMPI